jgi:hypothetical protein
MLVQHQRGLVRGPCVGGNVVSVQACVVVLLSGLVSEGLGLGRVWPLASYQLTLGVRSEFSRQWRFSESMSVWLEAVLFNQEVLQFMFPNE